MSNSSNSRTSPTLMARLQQQDPQAWSELMQRYGPALIRWCRSWNLQEADAQDLTQEVLMKLARRIQEFHYDPAKSFRAYLKTLAHYAWCDLLAERRTPGAGGGDSAQLRHVADEAARDDLARRLEEEYDRELLDRAMEIVRARVEPQTWNAFRLTALENLSGTEVAERLGMSIAGVFKARSRIQQMLKKEVAAADNPVSE